jgi:hypothetical protein
MCNVISDYPGWLELSISMVQTRACVHYLHPHLYGNSSWSVYGVWDFSTAPMFLPTGTKISLLIISKANQQG